MPSRDPDGRFIAALSFDWQRMVLFEFATAEWPPEIARIMKPIQQNARA